MTYGPITDPDFNAAMAAWIPRTDAEAERMSFRGVDRTERPAANQDDARPTIEVAECPYGCGELHEVERIWSDVPVISCVHAPSTPMFLQGFGKLQTRTVRMARGR